MHVLFETEEADYARRFYVAKRLSRVAMPD